MTFFRRPDFKKAFVTFKVRPARRRAPPRASLARARLTATVRAGAPAAGADRAAGVPARDEEERRRIQQRRGRRGVTAAPRV